MTSTQYKWALVVLVLLAGVGGCSAQNETIGQGDASLVFTNSGDISSPLQVRWADARGRLVTERFTVLPTGRVTLRVPARLQYDIDLAPSCAAGAVQTPGPAAARQVQVIDARRR